MRFGLYTVRTQEKRAVMREIEVSKITEAVRNLFIDCNHRLPPDVLSALSRALEMEESAAGRVVISELIENAGIAANQGLPVCQDTGLAVVFMEIGQDVRLVGGSLKNAINEGVRQGALQGYLRSSTCNCFSRRNTGDNTPAVIHLDIVPGNEIRITLLAKGGGSENMSGAAMLTPASGPEGVKQFVIKRVREAGANPCPPIIVGVGLGGTLEQAALLAKKALLRPLKSSNPEPELAAIERDLYKRINDLGIGPAGYGGRVTALAVLVAAVPCHIASLPVAVNIQCHAHRHQQQVI